ncbi:hypothetical protein RDWZM_008508 [Blomia tropicalis]|uniref:Serine/threonine-protein phosphatase n=1 Tax=Blomia tropicalis TaxID=40697 RepID=A0A9Q0M1H8_BLOTA|nr:hypothetical protein RDWZM_008508 [Blomia tropicalis]
MHVLRIQLPHTLGFVTRLIYFVQLSPSTGFVCCQNSKRIKWLSINDIINERVEYMFGPELIDFIKLVLKPITQKVTEYSLEEAFFFVPRDPPRNPEEAMLKSIHITEKDVERVYADFIEHCFPSFNQTFESFKCYISKYGFDINSIRLQSLFRAFNFHLNGYLSFHEVLLGIAALEPNIGHGEFRTRFIFRYYDTDYSGTLNADEFRLLVLDMNPGASQQVIDQKVVEGMQQIGTQLINGRDEIVQDDFVMAVGSRRFRGTSCLCRSTKPIFTQITRSMAARTLKKLTSRQNMGSIIRPTPQGECVTCKEKEYTLATHSVKINSDGKIVEPIQVLNCGENRSDVLNSQMYSIDFVFNKNSAANVMLKLVRQFNKEKGTNKEPKGLLACRPVQLWNLILALYNDIDVLLNEEDKCPRVFSPCYIIGDIHGNLEDLLSLEKALWKRMPCVGSNFVFLGDYVDRGQWGLECSLYLMAFKALCPNKVTMLRGNHEVRTLQTYYTYKRECVTKYGEEYGIKIWELTNKIFDKLPVAAVVDDAIYCAHGGIPRSAQTISQINQIKRELVNPEVESAIAWEILWSDPCHAQQFIDICNFFKQNPRETGGFVRNTKRGTAFLFNEVGANGFLQQNGLTHIVRAHEVPQRGYMFHFGQKCVTIFSCSHYCGNDNACSCVLADNQVMRVIRLDTVNNAPATD